MPYLPVLPWSLSKQGESQGLLLFLARLVFFHGGRQALFCWWVLDGDNCLESCVPQVRFNCWVLSKCPPNAAESLNDWGWHWLWQWPWLLEHGVLTEERASPKQRQHDVQASGYECIPPTPSSPSFPPLSLLPLSSVGQVLSWWWGAGSAECLRSVQGQGN